MEIAKKIFNIVLVIITIVAVFATGLLVYYKTIGKDKLPTGITSTLSTTITDPQSGEELPVLEANFYENANNHGKKVIEFKVNCYEGVGQQVIYARGFQLVYDNNNSKPIFKQYNSSNNVDFVSGHYYNWGDKMPIEIDNKPYEVALDGKYETKHSELNSKKIARTVFCLGMNLLFEDVNYQNEYTIEHEYTFEDLLVKIGDIIKSCSNGTGDSIIPLIDLGNFLHIYEPGSQTPLGDGTFINSYFTMKTHYDRRGMVWAKQSMFKSVAGDSNYNITGLDENVDYWQSRTQYNLTIDDFKAEYNTAEDGYYYSLPLDLIDKIKTYKKVDVNINFDISSQDKKVLGFDFYALNGIKVKSLTISSNQLQNFKLLNGSLKDTGLTNENIKLNNVKLINDNCGVAV